MRWLRSIVLAAVVPMLLSGCGSPGPDFTVPGDAGPEATIRPSGNATEPPEPYVLRIEVRHESASGEPLSGAAVVFFDTEQPADTEAARTGPDGQAIARFFIGGTVTIAAGGLDGYTVEEAVDVVLGDPGEEDRLLMILYDAERTVTIEGGFPAAVGLPVGPPAYSDVALAFSGDGDVDAEYMQRLVGLRGTLAWSNGPHGAGDLFAGVRSSDGAASFDGEDRRQLPADLDNEETLDVPGSTAQEVGEAAAEGGGLALRAQSRSPVVTSGGLPFTFNVTAAFKGSDVTIG